jgi:hypothetical protein
MAMEGARIPTSEQLMTEMAWVRQIQLAAWWLAKVPYQAEPIAVPPSTASASSNARLLSYARSVCAGAHGS